ncbi:MAG: transcription termination/antitermination protein NusA [Chloroflexi bacterium]|nr:transcription termination/antitermination protein NusA [Chloroflexota bacterium]
MKNEFALAFNEVLEEKQLPKEVVVEALESAMVSAYRKTVNASSAQLVQANFDLDSGEIKIFAEKEVVEEVQDERTEVTLEVAQEADAESELGSIVVVESTPENFGRVAAQTARQVIQQRIREAERQAQYEHFQSQVGEIINGIVQAVGGGGITLGMDRNAEGTMPRNHQIRGERFRNHDRVRALLYEVKQTPRGPQIILSRAHKNFLRRLLEDEVPEIYHGLVEIRSIAREPGYRSKVAVSALQPGIDPVGACVGIRGVRIQAIVRELHDEKIDVIEWNPDPSGPNGFISKALSPARVSGVFLNETDDRKTATVVVPEDQLSLAIGRDGQNARLAAKLTGWRIDIKSLPEAASDAMFKLQNEPAYADNSEATKEMIPKVEAVLGKKAEGRPVTPEEYQLLTRFVNFIEIGAADRRQAELNIRKEQEAEVRDSIPATAFDIPMEELGISLRIANLLAGEGYAAIGDLMMQMAIDKDVVLAINGMGPKTLEEIDTAIEAFDFPVVEEVIEEVVEVDLAETAEETEIAEETEVAEEETTEAEAEPVGEEATQESVEEIQKESEEELVKPTPKKKAAVPKAQQIKFVEGEDDISKLVPAAEKKKKGSKKAFREIEYDPDKDITIVRRRRKGDAGWSEDDWE